MNLDRLDPGQSIWLHPAVWSGVIDSESVIAKSISPRRGRTPYQPARSRRLQALLIFYVLIWPVVLLAAPAVWLYSPWAGVLYAVTVGLHVNTQLGFFYHELWHKVYFKNPRRNRFFYWVISLYHFSDPQIYGIAHATHHKDIHTFDDLEFWPKHKPKNATGARVALVFELFFGIIAWTIRVTPVIWKHKSHSKSAGVLFIAGWVALHALLMGTSYLLYGSAWYYAAIAYWLQLLLFGVALRMLQFLEHLGITAPELDYKTRANLTRNTRRQGVVNLLWHKLTLNETAEHTLHHFRAGIPYRRYMPLAPPEPSAPVRTVSATMLPAIIRNYWRDPLREIGPDSPDLDEIP